MKFFPDDLPVKCFNIPIKRIALSTVFSLNSSSGRSKSFINLLQATLILLPAIILLLITS
jgi:hypothetical protein